MAVRFFLRSEAGKSKAIHGTPITGDQSCRGCGYNLRGLKTDMRCPECGTPILERNRTGDLLLNGDHGPRRRLGAAFACMGWSAGAMTAGRVAAALIPEATEESLWYAGYNLAASCAWALGAWMAMGAYIEPVHATAGVLRRIARVTQLMWAGGMGLWVLRLTVTSGGSGVLLRGSLLLELIAALGLIPLLIVLRLAAENAELDVTARRINLATWLAAPSTLMVAVIPVGTPFFEQLYLFVPVVLPWAWVMSRLVLGMLDFSRHVRWGLKYEQAQADRTQRVNQTRQSLTEQAAHDVRPLPKLEHEDIGLEPGRTHPPQPGEAFGRKKI